MLRAPGRVLRRMLAYLTRDRVRDALDAHERHESALRDLRGRSADDAGDHP